MHQHRVLEERGVAGSGIEHVERAAFDPVGASGGPHRRDQEIVGERVVGDVIGVEVAGGGVDDARIDRAVVVQVDLHIERGEGALGGDPLPGGGQPEEDPCRGDVAARFVGGRAVGQQIGRAVGESEVARRADAAELEHPHQARGLLAVADRRERQQGRPRPERQSDPQRAGMARGQRADDGVPRHMDGHRPAMEPQLSAGFGQLRAEAGAQDIGGGRIISYADRARLETEGHRHLLAGREGDLLQHGDHPGGAGSHRVAGAQGQRHRLGSLVGQSDPAFFGVGAG